jgi:hypothetical protein
MNLIVGHHDSLFTFGAFPLSAIILYSNSGSIHSKMVMESNSQSGGPASSATLLASGGEYAVQQSHVHSA